MIVDGQDNNSPQISEIAGYEVVNKFNYLGSFNAGPRSTLLNRINLQYLGNIARRSGTMDRLIIEGKETLKRQISN